jgi:2-polyprenyl-3-methyl-5-hydroxy-6-metoxy-1,4-benzoquinol methylase
MTDSDYRRRIYEKYTSDRTPGILQFTEGDYLRGSAPTLHRIGRWLPPDRSAACLDVGCGGGHLLYALQSAGYANVSGIDVSPEQCAAARRICANVVQGDATRFLQGNAERFDLITAFDVVEHLHKSELFDFLDAVQVSLREGGRLIVQTPNADSPWGMGLRYGDLTHEIAFDPRSLEHATHLAGFGAFEARECGPYAHGLASALRTFTWSLIRTGLIAWNLVETGTPGSGVFTRVFIAKADKLVLDR